MSVATVQKKINKVIDTIVEKVYDISYSIKKNTGKDEPMDGIKVLFIDKGVFIKNQKYVENIVNDFMPNKEHMSYDIDVFRTIKSLKGKDSGIKDSTFPNNFYAKIKEDGYDNIIIYYNSSDIGCDYLMNILCDCGVDRTKMVVDMDSISDIQLVYLYHFLLGADIIKFQQND